MRILIVGAGAVGGYFGGRLLEKGVDVTYLVREKRKQLLSETGLQIESVHGDLTLEPKTITSETSGEPFDLILVGMKSYHFEQAIQDIKPYVGPETMIIPLLNGIQHLDRLIETFSEKKVLGGLCFIESTVGSEGKIIQTSPVHELVYGELSGEKTERISKVEQLLSGTKASIRRSDKILTDMWHKYMFITGLSGVTTLFRSPIGPIRDTDGGREVIRQLFYEIGQIMRAEGAPIRDGVEESQIKKISEMSPSMKSSMQRDMEKGDAVEGDHLQGYLLQLAEKHSINAPTLEMVYSNLKVYEQQNS
ncbi:ketopantoate reductase family protein [Metabacillus herbersteinensis]|uniref:2-dehydropantoate 2-reductase n=1 Tax=Metabacillus herbersteinensis TaxID=283816 RepID=A0ABV6GAS9_9BACI